MVIGRRETIRGMDLKYVFDVSYDLLLLHYLTASHDIGYHVFQPNLLSTFCI